MEVEEHGISDVQDYEDGWRGKDRRNAGRRSSIIESPAIERSALGRVAQVGDLYDAHSECFTGISILNKTPPESCIRITDNHTSNIEYVFSDNFADKCDKLNIGAELQVSVLAGLIKLGGSGKYLQDEKHSARAVRSSLIYNIQTQVEHVNLFADELKECYALDALNVSQATHVVVEVRWGANSMVMMEYANEENESVKDIKGDLLAELKMIEVQVKGDASVEISRSNEGRKRSFALRTFADILPTGELPQTFEGALEMMKKMPQCLASANNGKGKPLSYLLRPLTDIKRCLHVANIANKTLKMIDEETIIRYVKLFNEISEGKQKLHDLHEDMKIYNVCITEEEITSVSKRLTEMNALEAKLKAKCAKILTGIRSGKTSAKELESLRKKFENSLLSSQCATKVTRDYTKVKEKITFVSYLRKEGVAYVGKGSSLEAIQMKHNDQNTYILFYSEVHKQADPLRWGDHISLFLNLINDERLYVQASKEQDQSNTKQTHSFFVVVDVDLRPDLKLAKKTGEEIICLCLWKNGKCIDKDVVTSQKEKERVGLARFMQDPQPIGTPPNKRVILVLCCPGSVSGTCPNTKLTWFCEKCNDLIEYGFDGYFYCKCGGNARLGVSHCKFRCNNSRHGLSFLSFAGETLNQFLAQLNPMADCMNVLILGETGVGKSTWINGIANYMSFATIEEAKENEPMSLIGASFTVTDDKFEEKVITIGDTSNEDMKVGQSATQDPKSYVFWWNDTLVRLIDTPGIGDTRGIDQDKANFDAILRFLAEYEELHGICILLKPNTARLGVMFKFCIKELLTHLHRSCSENIVFCFTNARNTFYRPGDTFPALKKLLAENKDVEITLSSHTVYCMDNESFRYLCMIHNGVASSEDEFKLYSTSWDKSVAETNRLLTHVQSMKPHKTQDTVSLNDTRRIIVGMTKPVADISQNIQVNIAVIDDKKKEIESSTGSMEDLRTKLYIPGIDLEAVPLNHPRTVCTNSKCVRYIKIENTGMQKIEYVKHCHESCELSGITPESFPNAALKNCAAMDKHYNCMNCGCSWEKHMHITYEQKQTSCKVLDTSIQALIKSKESDKEKIESVIKTLIDRQKALEEEQNRIRSACVKFGNFLANNALLPYNDALADYLDVLIKLEQDKCAVGGDRSALEGLQKMRKQYAEEVNALKQSMESAEDICKSLSVHDIKRIVEELYELPIKGAELRQQMEVALCTKSRHIKSQEVYHKPPPNSAGFWNWMKKTVGLNP